VKKLSLIAIVLFIAIGSSGQDSTSSKGLSKKEKKEAKRKKINDLVRQAEEGVLVYSKQSILGAQLRTNGYGIF
jgi:hypothetical protein